MKLGHWLFAAFLWCLAWLSLSVLYRVSNGLFFIVYHVVKYRRAVVEENLRRSFPDQDKEALERISRAYYHNLCDLIVEIFKLRHAKFDTIAERFEFKNLEIIHSLEKEGKSIIAMIGHCGNWEWMSMVLKSKLTIPVYGVYKPLSDKFFDKYMRNLRSRFYPDSLIPFKETYRFLIRHRKEQLLVVMAGDQTPHRSEINFWTPFLNQDTPVFLGAEKIAQSLDYAVVFFEVHRTGRGRYSVEVKLLSDDCKALEHGELTKMHVGVLEKALRKEPDNWLWSHKRWKYSGEKEKMN